MSTYTEYITLNKDGCFIGGRPADRYRSELILTKKDYVVSAFTGPLHKLGVQEIHALTSKTRGTDLKPGKPSGKHGKNIWCRITMIDGTTGKWIHLSKVYSARAAAMFCVKVCIDFVWDLGEILLPKQPQLEKTNQEIMSTGLDLQNTR